MTTSTTANDRHQGVYRLGIDVGGTFTDLVLVDPDGTVFTRKALSSSENYAVSILSGMADLFQNAGVSGRSIGEFMHATTIATNAILEQRGAKTALITTEGFRDVLEIGRLRLSKLYNLAYQKPAPLVRRGLRRTVGERIDHRGEILRELDMDAVDSEVQWLLSQGVESIAVCLLHSYANDTHEQAIGRLIRERAPHVALTLSSELLPEVREYERSSTAVTNAYVMPVMRHYLCNLEKGVAELGVSSDVLVMQSSGGVMTVSEAYDRPVCAVESGPAAGVVAAAALAKRTGEQNAISFDMGGTTAKAAVIEDFRITRGAELEVGGELSQMSRINRGSGYLLRMPAVDLAEVGAGGGSILAVDKAGRLHVGPESAGALPGPACYGQGGTKATLTDANVVLGYLPADSLPSGLEIDSILAHRAIEDHVAKPLGLDVLDAARGVFELGCARMARAVRAVTVERGRDARSFAIVAFGGNGPLFAAEMARTLGIRRVIVPPSPGVFSARGLLDAEIEHHAIKTVLRSLAPENIPSVVRTLADLESECRRVLASAGDGAIELLRSADLRYEGQSFELTVGIPGDWGEDADSDVSLAALFAEEHRQTYGHVANGHPIQVVNARVSGRLMRTNPEIRQSPSATTPRLASRPAYFGQAFGRRETPVIGRADLAGGPRTGPLLIDEYDATTSVPPGSEARLDEHYNIAITVE